MDATGIDVSRYQGAIDWPTVAAHVDFAYVRAGIGSIYKDPRAFQNVTGATAAGLLVGVYHVVRWDYPAADQLANLRAMLAEMPPLSLPIALDVELPTPAGSTAAHRAALAATRELVTELARDHRPLIYTGAWWWDPAIKGADSRWALTADLWTASYTATPRLPSGPWAHWHLWQHSSTGRIPGIAGNVDLNRFAGTRLDLVAYAVGCGCSIPPTPPPTTHTITVTGHNITIQVD